MKKVDDDINVGSVTPSSSVESFMSALSQLDDESEGPGKKYSEEPQKPLTLLFLKTCRPLL